MPDGFDSIPQPTSPEAGAWDTVRSGWRLLYGGISQIGYSFEAHDFRANQTLDWGKSFHPDCIELCLNLEGHGELRCNRCAVAVTPGSAVIYRRGTATLSAIRSAGQRHRFLTLELDPAFLSRQVAGAEAHLDPLLTLKSQSVASAVSELRQLHLAHEHLVSRLITPGVAHAALPIWFQSKALELIAEFMFIPEPELFCHRQKRLVLQRIQQVKDILERNLERPPSLEALGQAVGVSQYYLSRTFSAEVGLTIPQYIRRARMMTAAELIRSGTHNVGEAAFAVGYTSLGHFSKAFCEVIGCCPTLYPHTHAATATARRR